ncbi:Sulfotransferase [Trinorchestia longiramus]|nr:Sulfotransferase [Trinorchestia longiramus]
MKVDEMKVGEMKVDEMKVDEMKVGEMKVDEMKVDEMKVDEMKVDEMKTTPQISIYFTMRFKIKILLFMLVMSLLLLEVYIFSKENSSSSMVPVERIIKMFMHDDSLYDEVTEKMNYEQETQVSLTQDTDEEDREKVFAARRKHVKKICSRNKERMEFGNADKIPLGQFRWLKKRDMVVCFSAKVGTSTWLRYLIHDGYPSMNLTNKPLHGLAPRLLAPEHKDSREATMKQLMNSTRIANVRHPFTRLVSAFKSKFEPCRTNEKCNGRYLVKDWRSLVDFKAFVQFLIKRIPVPQEASRQSYSKYDRHWRPYYLNCAVCNFDFDYIVKMETFKEDLRHILNKLGFELELSVHANVKNASDVSLDYFKVSFLITECVQPVGTVNCCTRSTVLISNCLNTPLTNTSTDTRTPETTDTRTPDTTDTRTPDTTDTRTPDTTDTRTPDTTDTKTPDTTDTRTPDTTDTRTPDTTDTGAAASEFSPT